MVAGHTGDEAGARAALADAGPDIRAAGLAALARMGALRVEDLAAALTDPAPAVRRRACDLAGRNGVTTLVAPLVRSLSDGSSPVVEAACLALGELGGPAASGADTVATLAAVAGAHQDPLCREAAVASLGAIGAPDGLAAVLAALSDKPAVRRRAVVALAAFEGETVDQALATAATDSDWQVRQVAEDLLGARPRLGH